MPLARPPRTHTAPALLALLAACVPVVGPAPRIDAVAPATACEADGPVTVVVSGAGFAPVVTDALAAPALTLPTLSLTRAGDATGATDGTAAPAPLLLSPADGTLRWDGAGTLSFDASWALGLFPGAWDLAVANPDGQTASRDAALVWAAAPTLVEVAPAEVCIDAPAASVTITGAGFLFLDGVGPSVEIGLADPVAAEPGDCLPLAGERDGWICTSVTVPVDATALPLGEVEARLTNPAPAACAAASPIAFTVTLPPAIVAIGPAQTCAAGGVLRITGERLPAAPTVTVGGVPAASVVVVDAGTLDVTVAAGTPDGVVEVVVAGADGCAATATVEIVGSPDVFFVDPPAMYEAVPVEVTAWLADLTDTVTGAWIEDASGARTDLAFAWDPAAPGQLRAEVPAGLPSGDYAFGVLEADGCGATLEDAFTVRDTLGIALDRLDPADAWTWDHTPVEVRAEAPPPTGYEGFLDAPRVYLSAVGGGDGTVLSGVDFRDAGLVTATVPPGLAPGAYDVLVVNPDRDVGYLPGGLVVREERPPTIASVTPVGLANTTDETVTVRGESFRDPSVALTCREDGVEREVASTVLSATGTRIEARVPSNAFGEAVCVLRVTNDDGAAGAWAALSIRNPAENLFPWSAGTEMTEARRAPVATAGRSSSVARWVYALGGDDGATTGALASAERASIGVYGTLGDWAALPDGLPGPRTLAVGATIGGFVYLVGGDDGGGPLADGWRARILDPMEVPRFEAVSIDDGGSLGGGQWTWRIAARYAPDDLANPDGESLPGDPITVALPDGDDLAVTVSWSAVEGAVGYRVYRSPAADTSGAEAWVADTTDTTLRDDGLPADPARAPLPEGALGAWVALPPLATARAAPCLAVAADPVPDPEIVHLYVAGGRGADDAPLASVEVLDVQIGDAGTHRAPAWRDAGVTLAEARWGCGGWTVDAERHSVVEVDEAWVYFGGGTDDARVHGTVDAGRVDEGGALAEWDTIDAMSPARAGFGAAAASDFLYAFGGRQGEPSTGGVSAELGVEPLPEVRNWNSLGEALTVARLFPGAAMESAVIVLVGGATDTSDASRSTDVTNW